jgi:hypothetical protein
MDTRSFDILRSYAIFHFTNGRDGWNDFSSPLLSGGTMQSTVTKERIESRLIEVVDQYRSMIIDPIEQEIGSSPNWPYLRSRLLKALGDRGLVARIREVVSSEFGGQS